MMTGTTTSKPPQSRKLSEVTRLLVKPDGITATGFGPVERQCNAMGVTFDEWQRGMGKLILAKTADGKYAATVGGVGMSLPRQVGKTYTVGAIVFALCIINPGQTVIWTSHHLKTTGETFLSMQAFAQRVRVAPHVESIRLGAGEWEINFRNGSRILFGARERGFGRGFSGVDLLICDEAQILTDRALDNMLPTLNTSANGLAVFMGTPPKPDDPSEAFERMRNDAISGTAKDLAWIECGAEPNADPDDKRQWVIANASHPHHTPMTSMMRLKRGLSPESWLREGLGIWLDYDSLRRLDLRLWAGLLDCKAPEPRRVALAVDVSPDRKWSSIGVAGKSTGTRTLVLAKTRRGTDWVVGEVLHLRKERGVQEIALVMSGQARGLQSEFHTAGIEFEKMSQVDVSSSCAAWQNSMKSRSVVHVGQEQLDFAVANARLRPFGLEGEIWDRTRESVDISPVVACAAAFHRWGLSQSPLPTLA